MLLPNIPTLLFIIFLAIGGCNSGEIARLHIENDSLRVELNTHQAAVEGMRNITLWLDSIDVNRNLLLIHFTTGTSREAISARLRDINNFVKRSGREIQAIQTALESSNLESSAYLAVVNALRGEVQLRTSELITLNELVSLYIGENAGLQETLKAHANGVNPLHLQASAKELELLFLDSRIQAMAANFKVREADAYYARALAVEETAKRTKLAPHKRRKTYKEALELYKKAHSLGKAGARADIARLESRR